MSFEKPERLLTKEEWAVLSEAAQDKAGDYQVTAGKILRGGQDMRLANFYAKKANRIYGVLIGLEKEYYETHPDEDPDKKGANEVLHKRPAFRPQQYAQVRA